MCSLDEPSKIFVQELTIVMSLLRKFLNEKGYQLGQEGSFSHKPSQAVEYCSNKNNSISVLMADTALGSFFYENFPCYFSNILR